MAGKWLFLLPWKQSVHFKSLGVGGLVVGVVGQEECLTNPPPPLSPTELLLVAAFENLSTRVPLSAASPEQCHSGKLWEPR